MSGEAWCVETLVNDCDIPRPAPRLQPVVHKLDGYMCDSSQRRYALLEACLTGLCGGRYSLVVPLRLCLSTLLLWRKANLSSCPIQLWPHLFTIGTAAPLIPSLEPTVPTGPEKKGPSGTNIIIGSIAGAILLAAIVLGGTGWGFKNIRRGRSGGG
ncbi:disintegrin and metalloproteinase domain-containing protein 11-like isoform X2 [Lates japonicus]|uniref:Disintegrin and metalloproteinase domain-containing protein 11-like isoform X2 n=1 Tax=Lates japonicus TaxID=270547 RepID=A0AAD3M7U6_LATJO|nr:disintegrin and metalloproteinase domain-containing protein 11-like isoform X2 [Lates japonicus]